MIVIVIVCVLGIVLSYIDFRFVKIDNTHRTEFENNLTAAIKTGEIFRMDQVTKFEWDKMFISSPYESRSVIEKRVGGRWTVANTYVGYLVDRFFIELNSIDDDSLERIVFIKGDRVICDCVLQRSNGDFIEISSPLNKNEAVFGVNKEKGNWIRIIKRQTSELDKKSLESNGKDKVNVTGFGIYLAKGENKFEGLSFGSMGEDGKYYDGKKVDLTGVQMESNAIITDKDIKEYNWKSHTIVLSDEFIKRRNLSDADKKTIEELKSSAPRLFEGSKLLNVDSGVVVISLNGDKIYAADFELPIFSSRCPSEITIADSDLNSITIRNRRQGDDVRQDKRIYDFFKKSGKLVE